MSKERFGPALLLLLLSLLTTRCSSPGKDFAAAERAGTIEAYQEFLARHPSGPLSEKARQAVEELRWKSALRTNTPEAYESFLRDNPATRFADAAKTEIKNLDLKDAEALGTLEAYRAFRRKYPENALWELSELDKQDTTVVEGMCEKVLRAWQKKHYPNPFFGGVGWGRFLLRVPTREHPTLPYQLDYSNALQLPRPIQLPTLAVPISDLDFADRVKRELLRTSAELVVQESGRKYRIVSALVEVRLHENGFTIIPLVIDVR